jgi:hypothetical protein
MSDAAIARRLAYSAHVCSSLPSVALSMLDLWERPWSTTALRFAAHILQRAYNRGCDVLEHASLTVACVPDE